MGEQFLNVETQLIDFPFCYVLVSVKFNDITDELSDALSWSVGFQVLIGAVIDMNT